MGKLSGSSSSANAATSLVYIFMHPMNRDWNILNWNIRGINDTKKWLALRNTISKANADIICVQETKR